MPRNVVERMSDRAMLNTMARELAEMAERWIEYPSRTLRMKTAALKLFRMSQEIEFDEIERMATLSC